MFPARRNTVPSLTRHRRPLTFSGTSLTLEGVVVGPESSENAGKHHEKRKLFPPSFRQAGQSQTLGKLGKVFWPPKGIRSSTVGNLMAGSTGAGVPWFFALLRAARRRHGLPLICSKAVKYVGCSCSAFSAHEDASS